MRRENLFILGALVALLGHIGLLAQVVPPLSDYDYLKVHYTPLAGFLTQRYYQGAGCNEARLFHESSERIGVCAPWNNTDGEGDQPVGSMGSHIIYFCQDDYCHESPWTDACTGPTSVPTELPTDLPTIRPTRRLTKRPSSLPTAAAPLSTSPTPMTTSPATPVNKSDTFVKTELRFPLSLNCTGDYNTTYWSVFACYKSGIVESGQCDSSGTKFGPDTSSIAIFVNGSEAPPPLLLEGLITELFPDAQSCRAGTNVLFRNALAGNRCIPTTNDMAASGSIEYLNNHDWISVNTFPGKADCAGEPQSRNQGELDQKCIFEQIVPTDAGLKYSSAYQSRAFTGAVLADLEQELKYVRMWWRIKIAVATLSSTCSALMLVTLFRINKWTFFNLVLVPLAASQLVFDLTVVSTPHRDVLVQEIHVLHNKTVFLHFAALDFFKEWAILNVFGITNLITLAVAYIFRYQRALQLGAYFPFVLAGIGCVTLVLPLALCVLRVQTLKKTRENNAMDGLLFSNGFLKATSFAANAVVLAITYVVQAQQSARQRGGATTSAAGGASFSARQLSNVLMFRLVPYPAIQIFTQVWTMWNFFDYKPHTIQNSVRGERGNTYTTDDAFYKTNDYIANWFLQSILAPSAGFLFFLAYIASSQEGKRAILTLVGLEKWAHTKKPRQKPRIQGLSSAQSGTNFSPSEATTNDSRDESTAAATMNVEELAEQSKELGEMVTKGQEAVADEIPEQDLSQLDEGEIAAMLESTAQASLITAVEYKTPQPRKASVFNVGDAYSGEMEMGRMVDNPLSGRRLSLSDRTTETK